MNYVLCHIGELPSHLFDSIQSIKNVEDKPTIILIADAYIDIPDVTVLRIDEIKSAQTVSAMQTTLFDGWDNPLWRTSIFRVFLVRDAMQTLGLNGCYHFDNDVLLFQPSSIFSHLFNEFDGLYITPVNADEVVFGFSKFGTLDKTNELCDIFHNLLFDYDNISRYYINMPNEMQLLSSISKERPDLIKLIESLPNESGIIFDPAGYGQYFGGTHQGHPPGFFYSQNNYIGDHIRDGLIKPVMIDKKPYVNHNGTCYPIVNLHIHSKKTKQFLDPIDLVRGEHFPKLANKVLSYYGEVHCDPETIEDGDIVYCDTHQINQFKDILVKKQHLTIITHNSDAYICDTHPEREDGVNVNEFSECFDKWYGQNTYSTNARVIPIPIGFENTRWEYHFGPKTQIIAQVSEEEIYPTTNIVYLNCNPQYVNIEDRRRCYEVCQQFPFVTADYPNLSYIEYLRKIKQHKFVLSPAGNGLDCHRTWEVLKMHRIPIIKREGRQEYLYKGLPVLFINDWTDLPDINFNEIYESFSFDQTDYLTFDFWKNNILGAIG